MCFVKYIYVHQSLLVSCTVLIFIIVLLLLLEFHAFIHLFIDSFNHLWWKIQNCACDFATIALFFISNCHSDAVVRHITEATFVAYKCSNLYVLPNINKQYNCRKASHQLIACAYNIIFSLAIFTWWTFLSLHLCNIGLGVLDGCYVMVVFQAMWCGSTLE